MGVRANERHVVGMSTSHIEVTRIEEVVSGR